MPNTERYTAGRVITVSMPVRTKEDLTFASKFLWTFNTKMSPSIVL